MANQTPQGLEELANAAERAAHAIGWNAGLLRKLAELYDLAIEVRDGRPR